MEKSQRMRRMRSSKKSGASPQRAMLVSAENARTTVVTLPSMSVRCVLVVALPCLSALTFLFMKRCSGRMSCGARGRRRPVKTSRALMAALTTHPR